MKHKTIYNTVLAFCILASLVFGVFMTLSIAQSTNDTITDINAYSAEKVKYFSLISGMFAAMLIVILIFTFFYKKKFIKNLKYTSKAYKYICILGGLISSFVVLFSIVAEFVSAPVNTTDSTLNSADAFYSFVKSTIYGKTLNLPYVALILIAVLSAVYFFYCVFTEKNRNCNLFAGLSMLPSLGLAAKLVFDFLMQNSNGYGQLYNYHLLSLGFFLLFSVNETRFYLRKAAPALYVFFGLSAAISAALFSIPVLVLSVMGVVKAMPANIMFCLVDVAIVVYIYARLFNLEVKIPKATKHGVSIEESETAE